METAQESTIVIIDTNILLGIEAEFGDINQGMASGTIYILDSVLDELAILARSDDQRLARLAEATRDKLMVFSSRAMNGGYPLNEGVSLKFGRVPQNIPSPLDSTNVDHQQIIFAVEKLYENPDCLCIIVTRDQEMGIIADAVHPNLKVISPSEYDVAMSTRKQLENMIWWNSVIKKNGAGKKAGKSVKPERTVQHPPADPQTIIDGVVRSLYARIRSERHRAILAIAPLEIRIALSAHLIPILTRNKSRVVFLFVPDKESAVWWAGELNRRCALPNGSIVIFGPDSITRTGPVRVVIYHHDQLERRLASHVARFKHAGKNITALVDGCDLLDPVDIAMLLFECDQFIGFSRLPSGHASAVGSRMLDVFFEQQTVASYSFADAEQDNWMFPFDVLRQEVELNEDEQELYDRYNKKFLTLHSEVRNKYPELQNSNDFWFSLLQVLARYVDHKAAELFALREQREAVAQMAQAKLEMVTRLVSKAGEGARCIIFDYESMWTKLLVNHLEDQGRCVEVIDRYAGLDEWQDQWRKFEANKVDCLIIQDVPPAGLNKALIKRLILLTPLTPLLQLAAMTDWVLSHANKGSGVIVDLLYTRDSPEQEAMMAFADTFCDLRFSGPEMGHVESV
jgi:hypothetical protein